MAINFSNKEIKDNTVWLSHEAPKMSDYEKFRLAIEMQRNRMIADAFVLTENAPSALEAIAIQLGYTNK